MKHYPVAIKRDGETVFTTHGRLEKSRGEPHDTLRIYSTAVGKFEAAVKRGEFPADSMEVCDEVVIERSVGTFTSYMDSEIEELRALAKKMDQPILQRDSRILVYKAGGFAGGVMGGVADITLDAVADEDFSRIAEIVNLLQTQNTKMLEKAGWVGDFGYYVEIGDKGSSDESMKFIFQGGPFSQTPLIVEELDHILRTYPSTPKRESGLASWDSPDFR